MVSSQRILKQEDLSCPNPKVFLSVKIDPDNQINEKNNRNNTLAIMHKHNLGPDYFIEDIAQGKKTVRTIIRKRIYKTKEGRRKVHNQRVKKTQWPFILKLKIEVVNIRDHFQ